MMIQQYPHFCYVLRQQESKRDENGNWIAAGSDERVWDFVGSGRFEQNGQGTSEKRIDGNRISYGGVFYSRNCDSLKRADKIIVSAKKIAVIGNSDKITKNGCILFAGYVSDVIKTQLNIKIYLNDDSN